MRARDFLLGAGAGFAAAYVLHQFGGGLGQLTGRQQNPEPARMRIPQPIAEALGAFVRAGYRAWAERFGEGVKYFVQEVTGSAPAVKVAEEYPGDRPGQTVIDLNPDAYEVLR